jgi:folate-dependent phosphoribosylglycinamide formyltransferase PurN
MLSDFLRVGVLSSKRAPGLAGLLHHPFRGKSFDVECVVSSDSDFVECGVPVITHPIRTFYDERNTPVRDRSIRKDYDALTAETFRRVGADIILLLGYLYVVTDALLDTFPGRVINIHDGTSKYPGLHATREAILAGESATFSMVHHVTRDIDAGPVIVMSRPFPVAPFVLDAAATGEHDVVRAYAYAHREWVMRSAWGGLAVRALDQLAVMEAA